MSRRRYLSTDISLDAAVNRLAMESGDFAALLYTWLIPHADDRGVIEGTAEEIMFRVLPGRRDKTGDDVGRALEAIDAAGLITWDAAVGRIMLPTAAFYRYQTYVQRANRREGAAADETDEAEEADPREGQRKTPQNAAKLNYAATPPQNAASVSSSVSISPSISPSFSIETLPGTVGDVDVEGGVGGASPQNSAASDDDDDDDETGTDEATSGNDVPSRDAVPTSRRELSPPQKREYDAIFRTLSTFSGKPAAQRIVLRLLHDYPTAALDVEAEKCAADWEGKRRTMKSITAFDKWVRGAKYGLVQKGDVGRSKPAWDVAGSSGAWTPAPIPDPTGYVAPTEADLPEALRPPKSGLALWDRIRHFARYLADQNNLPQAYMSDTQFEDFRPVGLNGGVLTLCPPAGFIPYDRVQWSSTIARIVEWYLLEPPVSVAWSDESASQEVA